MSYQYNGVTYVGLPGAFENITNPTWEQLQARGWTQIEDATDPAPSDLDEAKARKTHEIYVAFLQAPKQGLVTSFGFKMDCERDDIDNLKNLREVMAAQQLATTTLRDFNNAFVENVTPEMLSQVILEMQMNGLAIYQKKWQLEEQIAAAADQAALDAIQW